MSLQELIYLNNVVFGVAKPVIRSFFGCVKSVPVWLNFSMLQNQFIYTGVQQSILELDCGGGDLYYYYFDSYCCLADVKTWFLDVVGRGLDEVVYLFVMQNRIVSILNPVKGETTEYGVAYVGSYCRYYLVEYYQTRLMKL